MDNNEEVTGITVFPDGGGVVMVHRTGGLSINIGGNAISRTPRDWHSLVAQKDAAYEERNKVVSALARIFPSGIAKTDIPGWSEDWHGCVYIDLPTGQVSWHYHDSQAHLFAGLPPYTKVWDGHDTEEKYRRLAALGAHNGS